MNACESQKRKHCWHETGGGMAYGFNSGSDSVQCCFCGTSGTRPWHVDHVRIPGHGTYATQEIRRYGEVEVAQSFIIVTKS